MRVSFKGGSYSFSFAKNAGLIQGRVSFKGGSLSRIYGKYGKCNVCNDYVNNIEYSLPEEINRAKYRRNMVVMGPCFTRQELPAYFLISSGGLEGSASHLYLRQAGRPIF